MSDDEHGWYRTRWKLLSRKLTGVALDEIERLLRYCTLSADESAGKLVIASDYVTAITKAINDRAARNAAECDGERGPWAWILRLFDEPGVLVKVLAASEPAICGRKPGTKPEAALTTAFRSWANEARARLVAPDAPNRLRTWNEIRKSDLRVAAEYGQPQHPLERDHLLRVHHENLLKVAAGDKNLPRTVETLEDYYHEFDERCRASSMTKEDGSDIDRPDLTPEQVRDLNRFAGFHVEMREALMKMPVKLRPVFDHWMSLELHNIDNKERNRLVAEFCSENDLSRAEYSRRLEDAKAHLRDALKDML